MGWEVLIDKAPGGDIITDKASTVVITLAAQASTCFRLYGACVTTGDGKAEAQIKISNSPKKFANLINN